MQERPEPSALLDGVAQFLMTEVLPKMEDKALAFRVMIAANLSTVVAAQLRSEDERLGAELARLSKLVAPVAAGGTRRERVEAIRAMNSELVKRVRERGYDEKIF